MSISSTLIQACLTNVQKEFRQLEHWLNSLHPSEQSVNPSNDRMEATLRDISSSISQLAKQYEVQQLALNHIVDRLDILEGARDVQIDDNDDPWLFDSTSTCLENTIVEPAESVYMIHKEEESHTPVMTKTPPTSPSTASLSESPVSPIELVEEPVKEVEAVAAVEPVAVVEPVKEVEPVKVVEVVEEEVQVEEEQEEEEEVQVEEVEEEEQLEEEEEEGVELEEITYKEQSYYKDAEGFIYGIDEEGQPTDQPIGIWKEKSQSVAFYRLK